MLIENLPKIWIAPLLWTWNVSLITLTFDIGISIIYRFMSKNNPHKITIFNIIKQSTIITQLWILICATLFFAIFSQAFAGISSLFSPLLTLLLFTLAIRTLAIKFYDIRIGKLTVQIKKLINWLITDTALVILCIISGILGTLLNGIPFYLNNNAQIVALFSIESCLNATSLYIFLLLVTASIMQASIMSYIKTGWKNFKTTGLISSMIFLSMISLAIIPFEMMSEPFMFNVFSKNLIRLCFITLPISTFITIISLFFDKKILAILASCGIIKIAMLIFAMILFPNIVPSNIDISQSISCITSFSDIKTLQIMLGIFIFPSLAIALWSVWLFKKLMQPKINK